MGQYYRYPTFSATATNPSVGPTGAIAPAQATEVAGIDPSGNLAALQIDNTGALIISGGSGSNASVGATGSAVPADATYVGFKDAGGNLASVTLTAAGKLPVDASGVTLTENVAQWGGTNTTLGQKVMASSVPVAIASDQSAIPVSQSGTWTVQPGNTVNTTPWLTTINQGGNSATVSAGGALKVDGSAVTQPENLTQVGGAAIALGQTTMSASLPVTIASNQTTLTTKQAASTALTITQAALAVGTSAVRLTVSGAAPATTRTQLVFVPDPTSTAKFFFGSSTVTNAGATRGVQVLPGQIIASSYDPGDYWIISDTATQTVFVTEQS